MATSYAHIVRDDAGQLRVEPSWHKLIMLVEEHVYGGRTPVDMVEAHPSLTLGEAYEVLAFYYDHQAQLDTELAERLRFAEEMEAAQHDSQRTAELAERYEKQQRTPHS